MDLTRLADKFAPDDLEWRIGRSGDKGGSIWARALVYVTNRAIQNRLDQVCEPQNWCNSFLEWHDEAQLCGISIKFGGEWVTKWDGAEATHIEATKGGLSGAMKRAAVQWGIGRYLYELDETSVETSLDRRKGWNYASKSRDSNTPAFFWKTPQLPSWALPDPGNQSVAQASSFASPPKTESIGEPARKPETKQEPPTLRTRIAAVKAAMGNAHPQMDDWDAFAAWASIIIGDDCLTAKELGALTEPQVVELESAAKDAADGA